MDNDIQKSNTAFEGTGMGSHVQRTAKRTAEELARIEQQAAQLAADEERRRHNRRFNRVLYCISGALILAGVFIILRSETTLFTKNSSTGPNATFPPNANDAIVISIGTTPQATAHATQSVAVRTESTDDPSAAIPTEPPPTEAPLAPASIHFVGHSVSCTVLPVGIASDGTMETVPSHNVVGWYKYGAAPNQPGNCIIAGHNRYAGQMGSFSLLHNGLKVGDGITVELADGSSMFYRVVSLDTYRYDDIPSSVMESGGDTRLTLITCLGDFDYNLQMSVSRVVAVCEPVG